MEFINREETAPSAHWKERWLGICADLYAVEKRETTFTYMKSNPDFSPFQPVAPFTR
jgi:hypothetical protein